MKNTMVLPWSMSTIFTTIFAWSKHQHDMLILVILRLLLLVITDGETQVLSTAVSPGLIIHLNISQLMMKTDCCRLNPRADCANTHAMKLQTRLKSTQDTPA